MYLLHIVRAIMILAHRAYDCGSFTPCLLSFPSLRGLMGAKLPKISVLFLTLQRLQAP